MAKYNFTGAQVRRIVKKAEDAGYAVSTYHFWNGGMMEMHEDIVFVFNADHNYVKGLRYEDYAGKMEFYYAVARLVRKINGDRPNPFAAANKATKRENKKAVKAAEIA